MRRLVIVVVLTLLLAMGAFGQTPRTLPVEGYTTLPFVAFATPPADPVFAAVTDVPPGYCVRVVVPGTGYTSSGSGTVIACENGWSLVLTNRHVAPRRERTLVVTADGRGEYEAVYLDVNPDEGDLAVLAVRAELPAAEVSAEEPKPGEAVTVYGFGGRPRGALPKTRTGVVLPDHRDGYHYRTANGLKVTVETVPGDSGSGVFNARGRLVGVVWGFGGMSVRVGPVRAFVRGVLRPALFPRLHARLHNGSQPPPAKADPKAPSFAPMPPTAPAPTPSAPKGPTITYTLPPGYGAGCPGGTCTPARRGFLPWR